jgi:hypothetical protein
MWIIVSSALALLLAVFVMFVMCLLISSSRAHDKEEALFSINRAHGGDR